MKFALAPEVQRQRLLIEGYFTAEIDRNAIKKYFEMITNGLDLRTYGEPIIFSPGGEGKDINQGYDAFIPLIDSGIALYVWTKAKFFSVVIYTCKSFPKDEAIKLTKTYFGADKMHSQEF